MTVFNKVQDIIADELGKDKEEITLETTFEALDADSLDLFQIINDIEDEFDVEVDTDQDLKTVSELVNYVEELKKNNEEGMDRRMHCNLLARPLIISKNIVRYYK